MNVNKTGAHGTSGLALGERIKVVMRTRKLTVMVTLLRMHTRRGQIVKSVTGTKLECKEWKRESTFLLMGSLPKDFLPDVNRGWLVLQRSGLSESSKKTVLGSTANTLGRSRIVEALKQQWPDHELQVYDGDRKRDRDRKMRAYVQRETDEWEPEMHLNETAKESAWNANESRDA